MFVAIKLKFGSLVRELFAWSLVTSAAEGAIAPMQATEPTLMNGGTENAFCDRVAILVVDGNMANPPWSSMIFLSGT